MVVPLRPARFYGRSLPRPRFYTDVKFSDERVDPPIPVLDPLMSWASEAHWSMGGLCLNRLRLQGKIEGNVEKLRKQREKSFKIKIKNSPLKGVDSPPPAPISKKRRRRVKVVDDEEDVDVDDDDEEDEEEEEIEMEIRKAKRNGGMKKRRRLVRKLGDDFELVADANRRAPLKDVSNGGGVSEGGVALLTRSRRSMVLNEEEDEGGYDKKSSKSEKAKEKDVVSITPKKMSKKNGDKKGSVSPNGSRSSPRLKQKSN
ncbi:G patch domain-containing protein 4-like [Chenopodium quinoa]|uniref:Uncharacterized protein n=1 Tax=Chenopodium quinoa TaxID=63459 RepID=A0A803N3Z2_CHEQI|nr:G patch domain-containing protein 4-like [Chenopodium quinoa]